MKACISRPLLMLCLGIMGVVLLLFVLMVQICVVVVDSKSFQFRQCSGLMGLWRDLLKERIFRVHLLLALWLYAWACIFYDSFANTCTGLIRKCSASCPLVDFFFLKLVVLFSLMKRFWGLLFWGLWCDFQDRRPFFELNRLGMVRDVGWVVREIFSSLELVS